MASSLSRRALLATGALPFLSACAVPMSGSPPRVLSAGSPYTGARVERLYVYVFVDVRPELIEAAFHESAKAALARGLARSGVAAEQYWLFDVPVEGTFWD